MTQGWFQIRFTAPPRMYFSPVGRKQQSDATVQHVMCGECKVDEGDTQRHRKMVDAISAVARETQTKKRKTRQKKGRDGGQAGRQQGSGGGDGGASACSDKKHRRAGEARAREQGSVDRDRKELGRGSEEDDTVAGDMPVPAVRPEGQAAKRMEIAVAAAVQQLQHAVADVREAWRKAGEQEVARRREEREGARRARLAPLVLPAPWHRIHDCSVFRMYRACILVCIA